MKLSSVTRLLSQLLFWAIAMAFFLWLFKLDDNMLYSVMSIYASMGVAFIARLPRTLKVTFAFHMVCILAPIVFYFTDKIGMAVFMFSLAYIVLSYISKVAKMSFMNRGNVFQEVLIVLMYLTSVAGEYDHIYVLFLLLVVFTLLFIAQRSIERNEEYIETVMLSSVMDTKRMLRSSHLLSILIVGIVMLFSLLLALLGKVGPFAAFSVYIKNKCMFIYRILKDIAINETTHEYVEPQTSAAFDGESPITDTVSPFENGDTTAGTIRLIILLLILLVLLIICLYRWLSNRKPADAHEEEVTIYVKKEKKPKKVDPRKSDPSYGNRMTARRMYKRRVKGGKRGQRADLETRTPYEQKNKVSENGNEVSGEFVDLYERARYSKEKITKDDLKKMKEL